MPQNGILGWRVGWPRWMDWSKAHKHTAVNKEMLDEAIKNASVGGGGQIAALAGEIFVNARGDSMTGPLLLDRDPDDPRAATTKHYVDEATNLKLNIWDAIDGGVF